MKNWRNQPQSWTGSDPCKPWDGISCSSGRVTEMLELNLSVVIFYFFYQETIRWDLSNNPSLGGPLTPNIGNLKQLTILNLLGCSFTGNIPQEIGNLRQLTFLALNMNQFTGRIPPELGLLTNLSWLDLSANQLSGQIPVSRGSDPGLDKLVATKHFHFSENQLTGPMDRKLFSANMNLVHVLFDNNKLDGPIPPSLGLVKTLQIIRLDHNQFYGAVPDSIGNLTSLMELFMDGNGLNGTIPNALFSLPQMQRISLAKNTLGGSLTMTGKISSKLRNYILFYLICLQALRNLSISVPSGKKSSMRKGVIIGIAIAGFVLIVGLVLVAIYALRQKKIAKEAVERTTNPFASWGAGGKDNGDVPQLKGARYFVFEELKKCTNNFSETHEIGSGGYGKVYKGKIANGQIAAIKRAQQGSMQGAAEFKNEIELLSRVHHKNLVSLVGFCYEQGEQMLVYEYISNGTLRDNLMGKGGIQLDWMKRLKIAIGSAKGLAYLHELANPPIIHRDIKSTNILLDESLTAKVADFGLSKLVSDTQKGHVSTQVKGTLGYLDPEYYMTQQLSEKSDVYSFGVVMLELLTSRQPIEKGKYIVREIRTAIDQYDQEYYGLKSLIDPAIRDSAKLVGFRRFVQLAMECVEESAADRPSMNDVVKELETILQNEGGPLLNSASLSTEHFGDATGRGQEEHSPMKDDSSSSSAFDYNSVYSYSAVEPK
ncbi:leucine-rich repeat receptor protein kinase HPCA1-like [Aegilops tauschii subsp. strangulata]